MNLKTNPELLPLIEWWEKDGKQTVIYLLVAAIAVGGWYWWKHQKAAEKVAALESVKMAYTTTDLEDAVSKFGGSDCGGVLKLRLAASYYSDERYDDALAQYEDLIGKAPEGFADIPVVGKAQCLEALGRYADATAAFDAYANDEANTNSYLKLTAQLGAVRCLTQGGDKKAALARIETLKAANKDDAPAKAMIEQTESLVKRYDPAAKLAPTPAPAVAPVEKPAEKPAEAKPVEVKPATTNAPAKK